MTDEVSPEPWGTTLVESLTRTQIVQYAGASGDFNPVHTDEVFATRVSGQPSVFAHGMLTMGLAGRALDEYRGDRRVTSFGGRFSAQVWPGDALTANIVESNSGSAAGDLEITVTNQSGTVVFRGSAHLDS